MKRLHDQPLRAGELDVWVTYNLAPEGSYYPDLHNGFRTSMWGRKGYAADILFVEIGAIALVPGYAERVRVYTLNSANFAQWFTTEKVYWGPLKRPFGTLALASTAEAETYR